MTALVAVIDMHPLVVVSLILAPVVLLFAVWLVLIAPRARKKDMAPFLRPYAHRGLWNDEVPENSLAAFARAVSHGYAIELDVQLSKDGTVMVFHDYTLARMCGEEVRLSDLTATELAEKRLLGSAEHIPTLAEVLALVDGRVPLLIELKGESTSLMLCAPLAKLLDDYHGPYMIESFNPMLLRWFKKHRPQVLRGLLSTNLIKEKRDGSRVLNFLLSSLLLTFLCRPAFHAWDGHYPHCLALRVGLRLFGAASFVFTMKSKEEYSRFLGAGHIPIFDSFIPVDR